MIKKAVQLTNQKNVQTRDNQRFKVIIRTNGYLLKVIKYSEGEECHNNESIDVML